MNVEEIREMYPEGTQIILQEMQGESQMSKGLKGTVTHVDDAGHIHMSWENGSSLALVIDVDTFEKVEPVDLKPIGRIDYLHTDGRVCESVEYTNPSQFEKDIINKNNYGVPMIINFYKDKDGNHIPDSFLSSLDSPLQGIEYIDSPLMSNGTEEKKISIILVEPNKYPRVVEIEDTLEAMQKAVGGYIEQYMPFDDEVAIVCNEEGKMKGMPLNRAVYSEDKEILDIIVGNFFIAYAPFESEKFLSMPKELENKYIEKFKYPERFHKTIDGIKAIPYKPGTKERTQTL